MSVVLLIPILALFQLLSVHTTTKDDASAEARLEVTYPSRARVSQVLALRIAVENVSPRPLEPVEVRVDEDYLAAFEQVSFTPPPDSVTPEGVIIDLGRLEPGSRREVNVELRANDRWLQTGSVSVRSTPGQGLDVSFSTFILP